MVAYQFYWYDPVKGYELVGVIPERRQNPERITQESIMGWAKQILGDKLSTKDKDIYIIQVPINEYGEMVFQPVPFKK